MRSFTSALAVLLFASTAFGDQTEAVGRIKLVSGAASRPVVQHERTRWGGGWATFDQGQSTWLRRAAEEETAAPQGKIWREPLPVAFASDSLPLVGLLRAALGSAGVEVSESEIPVAARVLRASRAALVVCVNETAGDAVRTIVVDGEHVAVPVPAGRGRLVLLERATGRILASTPGESIAAARR